MGDLVGSLLTDGDRKWVMSVVSKCHRLWSGHSIFLQVYPLSVDGRVFEFRFVT